MLITKEDLLNAFDMLCVPSLARTGLATCTPVNIAPNTLVWYYYVGDMVYTYSLNVRNKRHCAQRFGASMPPHIIGNAMYITWDRASWRIILEMVDDPRLVCTEQRRGI